MAHWLFTSVRVKISQYCGRGHSLKPSSGPNRHSGAAIRRVSPWLRARVFDIPIGNSNDFRGLRLRSWLKAELKRMADQESPDAGFQTICKVGEIPDGEGRCFPVNGTMVGVFLTNGEYLAINDFCPHMGASLSEGHVEDGAVMCPWHAWRFDLRDGTWLDNRRGPVRAASYPVRVVDGEIQVSVPAADAPAPPTDDIEPGATDDQPQ